MTIKETESDYIEANVFLKWSLFNSGYKNCPDEIDNEITMILCNTLKYTVLYIDTDVYIGWCKP